MPQQFADIRIVDLDEEHTTRANPTEVLYDVHFVLSAEAPIQWGQFIQAHIGTRGIEGRRAWPQLKYIVIRCAIDEIEHLLTALRPILDAVNREYRVWVATRAEAQVEVVASDRREREKLRGIKKRLKFD